MSFVIQANSDLSRPTPSSSRFVPPRPACKGQLLIPPRVLTGSTAPRTEGWTSWRCWRNQECVPGIAVSVRSLQADSPSCSQSPARSEGTVKLLVLEALVVDYAVDGLQAL